MTRLQLLLMTEWQKMLPRKKLSREPNYRLILFGEKAREILCVVLYLFLVGRNEKYLFLIGWNTLCHWYPRGINLEITDLLRSSAGRHLNQKRTTERSCRLVPCLQSNKSHRPPPHHRIPSLQLRHRLRLHRKRRLQERRVPYQSQRKKKARHSWQERSSTPWHRG